MNAGLQAICAKQTPCKCCGTPAFPYGVVDFHKNCEVHRRKVLGGVINEYYRAALTDLTNPRSDATRLVLKRYRVLPPWPRQEPRPALAASRRTSGGARR